MSDSSDDEPLAVKRAKLENGAAKPQPASKAQVKLKEEQGGKTPSSPNKGNKQKAQEGKNAKEGKPPKTAKKSAKSSGDSKAEKVIVKREKKVYELPGQTRETPDELDPLRKFYTSLKSQRPESQMAKKWMCMYGLLSLEEAEAFLKEAGKNIKSPVKSQRSSQGRKSTGSKKSTAAKSNSASKKRKPSAIKKEDGESFVDGDGSEEKRTAAKPKQKVKKEPKSSKPAVRERKGKYAVFEDMDSDSDDDKPLGMRV